MPDIAKLLIALGCILFVGGILMLIGIMGENITRLRNLNVELKGENEKLKKEVKELEKELMKYDKKRKRDARKQDNSN